MSDGISTARSVSGDDGLVARGAHWLLLGGNRLVVAGGLVAIIFVLMLALVTGGILAVGPDSTAATAFGSGLLSGTLTVVTVALSINQLILSRVFGSPNQLRDRLDGTRDLRRLVQEYADEPVAPNDPAAFLTMTAEAVRSQAQGLDAALDPTVPPAVGGYAGDLAAYGEHIAANVDAGTPIVDVLDVIIGPEYAQNMTATEHVRETYGEGVPDAAVTHLEAIEDLLEAVAISRQFFKTIALQQDFARLSRILASAGVVSVLTSLAFALLYRTSSVTVPPSWLLLLVPVGIAIIVLPLAVFISYILRAATIARRTVSVGPFVPPQEQRGGDS